MQAMIDDLKQSHLFAGLNDAQLQRVLQHAVNLGLKTGESLFEQGDAADRFFLVRAGQVKLYRLSPAGNEKIVEIVMPGSTFAEALMFLDRPRYPVGAQALRPSQVISIDARDFASMLRESVDTCFVMLGAMSQRMRGLLQEIDNISLHSATCRVAAYLFDQAPEDADAFVLPVAKQVVASRLSVTPETFSRVIKTLGKRGVVALDGNQVTILDRDGLRDAAEL
jgi:CRP-like cAMP-binding protein